MIQVQNDKVRTNLLNSELRVMGLEPLPPETADAESTANKIIYQMHLDNLIETRKWAEKCRSVASLKK
jgi:hypothetical protein